MLIDESLKFLQDNEVLKGIFVKLHKRSQQDFLNATETQWKIFVDQMAERIQRRFWRECQQHIQWSENKDPILFPENTRLFYSKGNTDVIFIEQKPMVRSIEVSPHLVLDVASPDEVNRRFNLGFPYLVYAFKFRGGKFATANLFFMNAPLRKVSDVPLLACLSNLQPNSCKICFGENIANLELEKYDYSGQVESILNYYWNSCFTADWRTNFDEARKVDPRVATLRKWHEETKKNPMFIVEVKWPASCYKTFRHLCSELFSDDTKMREVKKEIYDGILSEEIQDAFSKFRKGNGDEKTSRDEADVLSSQFIGIVQDLVRNHANVSSLRAEV